MSDRDQTEPTPQRRKRKPKLAALLKGAAAAGKSVSCAVVYADRVELQFGEPESATTTNPWEKAVEDLTKQ
jgi:hypothetical protein